MAACRWTAVCASHWTLENIKGGERRESDRERRQEKADIVTDSDKYHRAAAETIHNLFFFFLFFHFFYERRCLDLSGEPHSHFTPGKHELHSSTTQVRYKFLCWITSKTSNILNTQKQEHTAEVVITKSNSQFWGLWGHSFDNKKSCCDLPDWCHRWNINYKWLYLSHAKPAP